MGLGTKCNVRVERILRLNVLPRQLRLQPEPPIAAFSVAAVGDDELQRLYVLYRDIVAGGLALLDELAVPKVLAVGDDAENHGAVIAFRESGFSREPAPFRSEIPDMTGRC